MELLGIEMSLEEFDFLLCEQSKGKELVVENGKVISKLPLPIAGLMSDGEFSFVLDKCAELDSAARSIGCTLEDPFMTMAFMSLPVIPELKVTDKGLFDTNKFNFTDMFNLDVEENLLKNV